MTCELPGTGGARGHGSRPALYWAGRSIDHSTLFADAEIRARHLGDCSAFAEALTERQEPTVGLLVERSKDFVATLWGTWLAGGVAVPLCLSHPIREWRYVLEDAGIRALWVSSASYRAAEEACRGLNVSILELGSTSEPRPLRGSADLAASAETVAERAATVVYTSGTTGQPKGAVVTHRALLRRIEALLQAWRWTPKDRLLHVLPLHHVHGLENALLCALQCGASVELLEGFEPFDVWERLASGDISLFMAVPTHYARLIQVWEAATSETQRLWSSGSRRLRLMVSGSAALSVETLNRWEAITGHRLLERYGMTEIGMAMANPYEGRRRPGYVGLPLDQVEVRRVRENGEDETNPDRMAELWIRSPSNFREYLGRADATADAFVDGWFRTGDMAVADDGEFRLLGRKNTDVLNVGGTLVSALEIEECYRGHPSILDCAAIGLADPSWGQRVGLVFVASAELDLEELREWAKPRLAKDKLPTRSRRVDGLPRNAMGKVQKGELQQLF